MSDTKTAPVVTDEHYRQAGKIVDWHCDEGNMPALRRDIANALAEAEMRENEACAKRIDQECDEHPARGIVLRETAATIRARMQERASE